MSLQTMLTAISMSAIATNGVVPGKGAGAGCVGSRAEPCWGPHSGWPQPRRPALSPKGPSVCTCPYPPGGQPGGQRHPHLAGSGVGSWGRPLHSQALSGAPSAGTLPPGRGAHGLPALSSAWELVPGVLGVVLCPQRAPWAVLRLRSDSDAVAQRLTPRSELL